jgi:hypothetical protein
LEPPEREYPSGELPEREPLPSYAEVPLLEVVWRFNLRDRVDRAMSYDRGANTLFVGTRAGVVLSIAGDNGSLRWGHDAVGEVSSAPRFDEGRVYVGFREPGGAVALDRRGGRQLWRTVAVGWVARDPVVTEDRVFFLSAGRLLSITTATGERAGLYNLGVPRNADLGSLIPHERGASATFNVGEAGTTSSSSSLRGGLLLISNPRRPVTEVLELSHGVSRVRELSKSLVAVHGPGSTGGHNSILSILDTSERTVRHAEAFHGQSRLLGSGGDRVYLGGVPPAVIALSGERLTTQWRTRRIHAGDLAVEWEAAEGLAVSGTGREGLVVYGLGAGAPAAHFELSEGLRVRELIAGRRYLYALVSTPTGSRARILALDLPDGLGSGP